MTDAASATTYPGFDRIAAARKRLAHPAPPPANAWRGLGAAMLAALSALTLAAAVILGPGFESEPQSHAARTLTR
jgi:hypothetical protein